MIAAARRIDRLKGLADSDARIHPVAPATSHRRRPYAAGRDRAGHHRPHRHTGQQRGHLRRDLREDESLDAFADVLGVNLTAPYHPARLTAEAPGPADGRSIINVSSILGLVTAALLGGASYSASGRTDGTDTGVGRTMGPKWNPRQRPRSWLVPYRDDRGPSATSAPAAGSSATPCQARRRRP